MPEPILSEIIFHPEFRSDLGYWKNTDRTVALRILDLADAIIAEPFSGIGNPTQLGAALAGCWSRRIEQEHRLVYRVVYRVEANRVEFLQARYHY